MAEEYLGHGMTQDQVEARRARVKKDYLSPAQRVMQEYCQHNFHDRRRHGDTCPQCGGTVPFSCN